MDIFPFHWNGTSQSQKAMRTAYVNSSSAVNVMRLLGNVSKNSGWHFPLWGILLPLLVTVDVLPNLKGEGGARAALRVQIISISCSFWENLAKSYVSAPGG